MFEIFRLNLFLVKSLLYLIYPLNVFCLFIFRTPYFSYISVFLLEEFRSIISLFLFKFDSRLRIRRSSTNYKPYFLYMFYFTILLIAVAIDVLFFIPRKGPLLLFESDIFWYEFFLSLDELPILFSFIERIFSFAL